MQHPLPKAVYLFNLATVAPPFTHTHTRPQLQARCSCGISLLPSCRTRTAAAAADEFLGSQLKRELQKALLQLQPHTLALAGSHTRKRTHMYTRLCSDPLHSTLDSTPTLATLDKLSTHIIYTFKRATLRHVELATRLRLAFYEFISVHLRPMWRCQLTEAVIKLNCLLLLLLLLLWRVFPRIRGWRCLSCSFPLTASH